MTLSDWINDIRWKYFTNEKAGLIFKELMKEFQMVDKMSENKRFTYLDYSRDGHIGSFYLNDKPITTKEVWELLKKQEEEIQRLKAQLECGEDVCHICKHTYLVPSGEYYIAQCKKGHSGCSKGTVDYCDDFELKDSDSK